MATRSYTGAAVLTKQITTVTPGGTIAATDTFSVTIGGTTYTFTATTTTVAHVVTGLYNLITAGQALLESPEWLEVTVTDSTTTLTVTAVTAGKPFTVSTAINNVSGGAAPTLTATTTTANSGPEQYDLAANWSGATLPVNGDTVIIEGNFNLRYGDLSSVTAAQLIIRDFTGEIGLAPIDPDGNYSQYRERYFLMSATVINAFNTNESKLTRINVAAVATTITVYATGTPTSDLIAAFTFKGTDNTNVFNVIDGSVGIATEAGETSTLNKLRVQGGDVETGIGVTLGTLTVTGGAVRIYNDVSSVFQHGGELTLIDDPDITSDITIYAGTAIVNGGPTITSLTMYDGSFLDCTKDVRPFVVTDATFFSGAKVDDPNSRVTWTNTWTTNCDLDKLQLRLGIGRGVKIT